MGHVSTPALSGVAESDFQRRFETLALPHLRAVYGLALRLTGERATA